MFIYTMLEDLIFVILVICKLFYKKTWVLNLLTFLPIGLTSLMVSFKGLMVRKIQPLYLSVFFALLGDLCFIYLNNVYGIYFFFLLQLCLIYYLNQNNLRVSYLVCLAFLILMLCYFFDKRYLFVLGILYVAIFLYNLMTMLKRRKENKRLNPLLRSFVCLSLCDINLLFFYIIDKMNLNVFWENSCFIMEWVFYICFQVFLFRYIVGECNKSIG